MEPFKCKMCGGTELLADGHCAFCNRDYGNHSEVNGRVSQQLFAARTAIVRDYNFTEAFTISCAVLEEFPENEEANWVALLSEHQIVYIKNGEGEFVPSFLRPEKGPLTESRYYAALNEEKRAAADRIEAKRKEVLGEWEKVKEKPYDVFISYKRSEEDDPTRETSEASLAHSLYTALLKDPRTREMNIFFDKDSLRGSNAGWEPHIYAAIKSAKMMIVVTSSIENMEARWVKNEWMRFLLYRKQGEKKELAVLCTSKNEVDPARFPDMIAAIKTQALFAREGDDWVNDLCGRAADAVRAASTFVLEEEHIGQKKREVIDKKKHKLNESALSFGSRESAVELDLGKRLDQLDTDLKLGHNAAAAEKLAKIKRACPDWQRDGQILTYDLAVRYAVRGKEALAKPESIEKIFETGIFQQIIENTTESWAYFILDALYRFVLDSGWKRKCKDALALILPYQYPAKTEYLTKLLEKAEENANSELFDMVLPWVKANDRKELLKICQSAFYKGNYETASRYAATVLNDYEKGNPTAQDILLLSKYRCKTYQQLFSSADAGMIGELKEILSYLSNEIECSCGARYDLDTLSGASLKCTCGATIRFSKVKTERINKLNEWNNDIIAGLADKFPDGFVAFYDSFLRLYPQALQAERLKEIAELAHSRGAFQIALHYCEFWLSTARNKTNIYWMMLLCDCGCKGEEELYSIRYYRRCGGKRIANNPYYERAFQAAASGTEFYEHIRSVDETQQAKFDRYDAEAEAEARRKAAKEREAFKDRLNKGFLIALPILVFLAGQAAQYSLYFFQNKVLLLDRFFETVNLYFLFGTSLAAAVSVLFVILSTWRLVDENYVDHPNFDAWFYTALWGVAAAAIPAAAGVLLFVLSVVIFVQIKKDDYEYIPTVCSAAAYLGGQAVSWLTFVKYGSTPFLPQILEQTGHPGAEILYLMIAASLICVANAMLLSFIGYHYVDGDEGKKAYGVLIPALLLLCALPVLSCLVLFAVSLILAAYLFKKKRADAKIPQIAWVVFSMATTVVAFMAETPVWVALIMITIEFLLCVLICKHDTYYQLQSFLFLAVLGVSWIVWGMLHLEEMLPKLAQIKEMALSGTIGQAYYESAYQDARTVMIIGTVVILLVAVIAAGIDIASVHDNLDVGTSFGGLTIPLMAIGSFIICCLVTNAFIALPEAAAETYEETFFLWTLVGSILTALPGCSYQAGAYMWGHAKLK